MTVSDCIRVALTMSGRKQKFLADSWDESQNNVANKFSRNTWTAQDLIKVARTLNIELAFNFPDGQKVILSQATPTKD